MNVHQKPRAGILLEVDLSVRPESYYYYYYYYYCMVGLPACSEVYEFRQLALGCPGSGKILFQRRMSFFY